MRKFILSLMLFFFAVSGASAAVKFSVPEWKWGAGRDAIAAQAQGELYLEKDAWLWYTSYDAYDECILETQYGFNAKDRLCSAKWHVRPQPDSKVGLAHMLGEYNRLKDVFISRYGAPYENVVFVTRGEEKSQTYPKTPPAPTAADIQPDTQYMFESRWNVDGVSIFMYVSVSKKGNPSIDISFNNAKYE